MFKNWAYGAYVVTVLQQRGCSLMCTVGMCFCSFDNLFISTALSL